MRHATAETLKILEPLLKEIRSVPGLVEKKLGIFFIGGRGPSCTSTKIHRVSTQTYDSRRISSGSELRPKSSERPS
jgi:hypothetical protein